MHSTASVLAVFAAGSALLVAALRWWRPDVSLRIALAYVGLTAAFFAQPLFKGTLQVPTDLAYEALPFADPAPPFAGPHNDFQADTLLEQLPFHTLVRQRLLAGEVPLWAHELGTGEPLLGNGQSAPFAPLHALALPLAPQRALTVAGAWQILLGLLTVHALLSWLGAGPWGAALAAVSAGLSTYAVVWIYDTPGMAAAWVPGVLLGILLVRAGAPRGWTGLLVCALGLALSGHPETMAHASLATAALTAALLLRRQAERWRFLARLLAAAVLAAALAAPVLLPLLENIPQSVHGTALARSPESFQPPPFQPRLLLPLFAPLALGSPPDGTYSLPWSFNEMASDYAGLLALALALAGALVLRERLLLVLSGGLAALLIALRLPPLFDLMLRLPVIGPGAHGRLREFWVLAVAIAAGLALERVAGTRPLRLTAAAFILAAAVALALARPPGSAPWPRAWWLVTLAGAAAALVVLLVPRLRAATAPLVVVAVTLDLFVLGVRYHPAVPAELDLAPPPTVAYLMQQARGAALPFRVSHEGFDLTPNLNALYGLWDPRGYDPMRPEDAARLVGWWLGHRRRFYQNIADSLPVLQQPAHDYLAVRFMGTSHQRELPAPWRLILEDRGGRVWKNPQALPLFFMPRRVERFDSPEAARHQALGAEDLDQRALTSGEAPPIASQAGAVRGIRPRSNGFDLRVDSPSGGLVVSSVSFAPGWVVRIGAEERPALEVNGGFLGFVVPRGVHEVRLDYRPRGWTRGLTASGGGLAFLLLALLAGRRHAWRRGGQAAQVPDAPGARDARDRSPAA